MSKKRPIHRMMPRPYMGGGVVRFMAAAEGWAMVRRPRCVPFLVEMKEWILWPQCDHTGAPL